MENQLYIRIRGRVLGPYDKERLQSMARRGQLSRMHELSPDATTWVRASTYPELFTVAEVPRGMPMPKAAVDRRGIVMAPEVQPPPAVVRRWWYRKNGAEAGPIEESALQQMLASGLVAADDLVWTDGMPQWAPARMTGVASTLPGGPSLPQAAGVASMPNWTGELPTTLCKSAVNSRSWALFIAVVLLIYAAVAAVAGIFALITGMIHHSVLISAWGLFTLIFGADVAAGACLLSTYAGRAGSLRVSRHPLVLEKALDTLRTFWVFVGINLIVLLAFLLFAVVWLIAVGSTIPWAQLS
jgi:hypothetical protein